MTETLELATAIGFSHLPTEDDARRRQYARISRVVEALLEPDRDQLRFAPSDAARYFLLIAFGGSHPRLTEGRPLETTEIADLLLQGIRRHETT